MMDDIHHLTQAESQPDVGDLEELLRRRDDNLALKLARRFV
jgi:hypothetical protein